MNWRRKLQTLPRGENCAHWLMTAADILDVKIKRIAEVGVFKGAHSREFRKWFPAARLLLVDPWKAQPNLQGNMYQEFRKQEYWDIIYRQVLNEFGMNPLTVILRDTSRAVATGCLNTFQIVYLDADHAYESVKEDIKLWLPRVTNDGILAGHDYAPLGEYRDVARAVNDTLGKRRIVRGPKKLWMYWKGQP